MNVLILGGLSFVGRHLVEQGLERGHRITVFTRGQQNPAAYPEIEKLRGDRDGNLSALEGRRWEVAIDTSGYVPRVVRDSARLLAGAVDHYTFVSTVGEYRGFFRVDCRRAFAAGLTCGPLRDTIRETREWAATFTPNHEWRAGLSRARERATLAAWLAEQGRP
jgi:uncharacterized protein YbjT (DUF2867 family)